MCFRFHYFATRKMHLLMRARALDAFFAACAAHAACDAAYPDLRASVPFYGRQPKAEDVPAIRAPLMLHYAELDTRINEGWPAYEAALKANGKDYQAFFYEGVNHGFHNDTTPRYDPEAAALAWERTMAFFDEKLR